MGNPIPTFDDELVARSKTALELGADYIRRAQVWHEWPYWTADAGRLRHDVAIKDKNHRPMLSLTWDCSRAAQAELSAYRICGKDWMLETARRCMEYPRITQIFAPEFAAYRGAFAEEMPQSNHIAARDCIEALQAFINIYLVTGDEVYLVRAEAAADWLHDRYMTEGGGWPWQVVYHREGGRLRNLNDFTRFMMTVVSLPFAQFDAIRGRKHYTEKIPMAMDWLVENGIEQDGSLRIHDGTDVGHHAPKDGPMAGCFVNDDGIGIALIACCKATGDEKYRETVLRYGEWWLGTEAFPPTYSAVPSALIFLLDMFRFTGDRRYIDKSVQYAEKVLTMQYLNEADEALHGGFIGHDGDDRVVPEETISLRTTMYAILALSKIAASSEAQWNMSYSAFGW